MKPTVRRQYVAGSYRTHTKAFHNRRWRISLTFCAVIIALLTFVAIVTQRARAEGDAELIDINIANADALQMLPGIGKVKAQAIVDHRKAHGDFNSIEDLMKVKGIGAKTFNNLKQLITVSQTVKKKMAVVRTRKLMLTTWGAMKRN